MNDQPTPAPDHAPLSADELRWTCDAAAFDFETTADLEANREIIGQARAVRAISLGLEMDSPGYNIFLAGFVGSGRNTTIRHVLQRLDGNRTTPPDLAYVYGFEKPERPVALSLPAGKARHLRNGMEKMVRALRREVPQVIEGDPYRKRREQIIEQFRGRQRGVIEAFDQRVQAAGFALVQVQLGPVPTPQVVPTVDGEPKLLTDLEEAADAGDFDGTRLGEIREKLAELSNELEGVVRDARRIDAEMNAKLAGHQQEAMRPVVAGCFDAIRSEFADLPLVLVYLGRAEQHVLENLDRFAAGADEGSDETPVVAAHPHEIDLEYRVNVIVDNHDASGAPVVVENAPTAGRLFGMIERTWVPQGEETIDHTRIRAGSLHAANGGYLVMNTTDLFAESGGVWNALKRTLRTGRLEILPDLSLLGPPALKPESVCISVKVVLIGDAHLYSMLYSYDDDFRKIFKVRADFDTEMPNVPENVRQYGGFVQRLVEDEGALPFDRTGLAELAEHGCRLSGRRDRLSTRFYQIADLVREAGYFARKEGRRAVGREDVVLALKEKDYRNSLAEEKMQEMIRDGSIFIDVEGDVVGCVNGLAVYDSGEYGFGIPSKITATVSPGHAGVINIEREADLSGRIHDKGVQILSGYLRSKYATDKPLTLSASICFEQSYQGVDGDSASSTEIYAILSALSGLPIHQGLAVTGSVNQMGEVQPIGGANEKIEGFFDVCAARGLTGTQGVLIPEANIEDLMLARRVVDAVHERKFHIHAIRNIDQGFEVLTGVAAGGRRGKRYAPRTANGLVDARLRQLANLMRDFGANA